MKKVTMSWFPKANRIAMTEDGENRPPYLHSLFVGLTVPILELPSMIWRMILFPLIDGIVALILLIVVIVISGIRGNAFGFTEDKEDYDK